MGDTVCKRTSLLIVAANTAITVLKILSVDVKRSLLPL